MMQKRSVLCKETRVTRCNAADGTSSKPTRTDQGPEKSRTDQGPKKSRSPEPKRLERHRSVEMVFWKNNVAEASKPRTARRPEKWLLYIGPRSPESPGRVKTVCSVLEDYLTTSGQRIPKQPECFLCSCILLKTTPSCFFKQPNSYHYLYPSKW